MANNRGVITQRARGIFHSLCSHFFVAGFTAAFTALLFVSSSCAEGPLRVAVPYLPKSLSELSDPLARVILQNTAYGLTKLSPTGGYSLELASAISSSGDQRRWTVTLREGVQFSSGRPLTPAAAANSLKKWEAVFSKIANVHNIEPSKGSVLITLNDGDPNFPASLASVPLLDPELLDTFGAAALTGNLISGAGPFTITSGNEEVLRLIPTPNFILPSLPVASSLEFRVFPSANAALSALRLGGVDLILLPTSNQLKLAVEDRTLMVYSSPMESFLPRPRLREETWGKIHQESGAAKRASNSGEFGSVASARGSLAQEPRPDNVAADTLQLGKFVARRTLKVDDEALLRLDLRGSYLP